MTIELKPMPSSFGFSEVTTVDPDGAYVYWERDRAQIVIKGAMAGRPAEYEAALMRYLNRNLVIEAATFLEPSDQLVADGRAVEVLRTGFVSLFFRLLTAPTIQ